MFKKPIKSKTIGIRILIPSIIILLWIILFSISGTSFGIGSGVNISELLPFLSLSLLQLSLSIFAIYSGIRYIRNKPYKQNKPLGLFFILLGIIYFAFEFILVLYSNISGLNRVALAQPIISFVWALILVSLGIGLRNEYK